MRSRPFRSLSLVAGIPAALLASAGSADAALLIDFGPGAAYTGSETPANAAGAVTGPQAFTAVDDDATVGAFGALIGVNLGRNSDRFSGDADFSRDVTPVSRTTGSGVFNTDLTNDAVASFDLDSGTDRSPVAVEISGLLDGDYTAFVVAHFADYTTNVADVYADTLAAGLSSVSDNNLTQQDYINGGFTTAAFLDNDGETTPAWGRATTAASTSPSPAATRSTCWWKTTRTTPPTTRCSRACRSTPPPSWCPSPPPRVC